MAYFQHITGMFSAMARDPWIIALIFGGSIMGLLVGVIPGLTATMALALLINISYGMPLERAVAFLLAVYVGATSGGLCSAIMINIPGTPAAALSAAAKKKAAARRCLTVTECSRKNRASSKLRGRSSWA